jgi:hypothetical protein
MHNFPGKTLHSKKHRSDHLKNKEVASFFQLKTKVHNKVVKNFLKISHPRKKFLKANFFSAINQRDKLLSIGLGFSNLQTNRTGFRKVGAKMKKKLQDKKFKKNNQFIQFKLKKKIKVQLKKTNFF